MWYSTIELSTNSLYDGCVRINYCPQMKISGRYLHLSVSHSVHEVGGGGISQHAMGRGCVSMGRRVCIPVCTRQGGLPRGGVYPVGVYTSQTQKQTLPRPRGRHPPPQPQRQTPFPDPEADTPLPNPRGRHHSQIQRQTPPPPEMTIEVRGTHPTGMDSCYKNNFRALNLCLGIQFTGELKYAGF